MSHTLILDIGKTNAKLLLHNEASECEYSVRCANQVFNGPPYPHFRAEILWQWFTSSVLAIDSELKRNITAICVTTHGATAALIDSAAQPDAALVLPILDYEYDGPGARADEYRRHRADFAETLSPRLPAGLNLGAQLFWLQREFPEAFDRASHILMYPQYWTWRLSGELSTEVSSLGCHSDLWNSRQQRYSRLVERCGWEPLWPPLRPAWEVLGPVLPSLAASLGLDPGCRVHVGVHDSNASYLRYLQRKDPFCVFSTGTWTIAMTSACDPAHLESERDMLGSTAVNGDVVACSRFMGGREYELVCARLNGTDNESIDGETLQQVMQNQCFALPNFCPGSGPFPAAEGRFVGAPQPGQAAALATLYCALMMSLQADLLQSRGDIIIEGAFLKNPWLCQIFAALRGEQRVYLSADDTGTVRGCAQLAHWSGTRDAPELSRCAPAALPQLSAYREQWQALVAAG